MNPADTNVSPVIHVAALELQNFLVICERGAKPGKTGPRYEWWDSSHVIQPFGSEVTDTLCTLRHLHVDTLILGCPNLQRDFQPSSDAILALEGGRYCWRVIHPTYAGPPKGGMNHLRHHLPIYYLPAWFGKTSLD